MKTIFITGCGTGIGKTWVAATLAKVLVGTEDRVQYIKPIECGWGPAGQNDEDFVARSCDNKIDTFTLNKFQNPLAPISAAKLDGQHVTIESLAAQVRSLPDCDCRIVESAGGIAVPIDPDGSDWGDLAYALDVDYTILVVEHCLGAINQARMVSAYASLKKLKKAGIWLNKLKDIDCHVDQSTIDGIKLSNLPLFGLQNLNETVPDLSHLEWVHNLRAN